VGVKISVTDIEDAFGRLSYGVYVVTARRGEKLNGLTAAWVCRTSQTPPMVMVSVAPSRYTHGLIEESGAFTVNVLAEGQGELGKAFGFTSGADVDKFAEVEYDLSETGCPIISGVSAYLDCRLAGSFETGDHTVFAGEVVDAGIDASKKPLVFDRSYFFG